MTTAQITGGTVKYNRPSNYQTDKPGAEVTLTFSCAEGTPHEEAQRMLDTVSHMAMTKAAEMVAGKPVVPVAPIASPAPEVPAANPPNALTASVPFVGDTAGSWVAPPAEPQKQTIIIGGPSSGEIVGGPPSTPAPGVGQPVPVTPASTLPAADAGPKPITDQDLVSALTAKNAKLLESASEADRPHVPVKLHTLVREFVQPPNKVTAIPPERRSEFLSKLAAL